MPRWSPSPAQSLPNLRLRQILPHAQFDGCPDLPLTGCATDLRHLEPGDIFVSLDNAEGPIREALDAGAIAALVRAPVPDAGHPQVVVSDPLRALGALSHALNDHPSRSLFTLTVSGDLPENPASRFLHAILESAGHATGRLSRDDWSDGLRVRPRAPLAATSPAVAQLLAAMVDAGSSHAVLDLPLDSLASGASFSLNSSGVLVAPLHQPSSLDAPSASLRHLARLLREARDDAPVLLCADDPGHALLPGTRLRNWFLTYGSSPHADVHADLLSAGPNGTSLRLHSPWGTLPLLLSIPGRSAALAAAAAAGLAMAFGVDPAFVRTGLESVTSLPGRLHRVSLPAPYHVFVDRARTGPELRLALQSLREAGARRLHCVLSARSDTDAPACSSLARAAEHHADCLYLAPDSPEDPSRDQSMDDLLSAFHRPGRVRRLNDRLDAIREAMASALPGEFILLSGRGLDRSFFPDSPTPSDDSSLARLAHLELRSLRARLSA